MVRRDLWRGALVLAALGLAVLAAGCGSSSSIADTAAAADGTTTTAAGPGGNAAAFKAYQACLKSHGVTLSFPGRPPGGQSGPPPTTTQRTAPPAGAGQRGGFGQLTAKQRAAMTACRAKLPAGTRGPGGAPGGAPGGSTNGGAANAAFKKYTACLKSHGVTFGTSSASSKTFAKATAACKSLLPTNSG